MRRRRRKRTIQKVASNWLKLGFAVGLGMRSYDIKHFAFVKSPRYRFTRCQTQKVCSKKMNKKFSRIPIAYLE